MEAIILLLIFILIPLANYALEHMRRRYQPPPSPLRSHSRYGHASASSVTSTAICHRP